MENTCYPKAIPDLDPRSQICTEPRPDTLPPASSDHEYHVLPPNTPESDIKLKRDLPVSLEASKVANPAPLGLCAFALTSFVMNSRNVYVSSTPISGVAVALPLVYGGLAQILVGMWEMAVGHTFGATTFCSYGAYWVTVSIISWIDYTIFPESKTIGSCQNESLMGVFMMTWFIFTTLMLLCTLRSNLAMFLLFFFLDMNYLLLGIAHILCDTYGGVMPSLQKAGGLFGLLAALAAWYNAFAGVFDARNGFFQIPVGHFPWSPAAQVHRAKVKAV